MSVSSQEQDEATPKTGAASSEKSMAESLSRLMPFLRPELPRLIGGVVFAALASLLALLVPQVLRWLVDGPIASENRTMVILAGSAVLVLGVIEAGLWWMRRQWTMGPALAVERSLRVSLYRKLQDLPVAFHDRWESGQLLSRSTTDLSTIRRWLFFGASLFIVNTVMVLVGFGILIAMNPVLGAVYVVCAIPITIYCYRFERNYSVLTRRSQDQVGSLATSVEQSVHGIRVLKAFGRGRYALDRFRRDAQSLRSIEYEKADSVANVWTVMVMVPQVALGISLALSLWFASQGLMSTGAITAFFLTAANLSWPIESLGFLFSEWVDAKTATDRVVDILDTENEVTDPEHPIVPTAHEGRVRFEHVHFRHADAVDGTRDLLDGIDLDVQPGETLALVGLTGSGKSVLTELMPRLYDVTAGRILLDGVDLRDMSRDELRSRVGMAFEEPTLFSLTVRENVQMGDPDATEDDVRAALAVAQAGFVETLPHGIDTMIGEEGHSLSGGQRQRIALARAILAKSEVLVLDDPLSALDVNTEALVEAGLQSTLQGTTTMIVAHRPSTVTLADRVALLRNGRIQAVGTHNELLATSAHYRHVISNLDADADVAPVEFDDEGFESDEVPTATSELTVLDDRSDAQRWKKGDNR